MNEKHTYRPLTRKEIEDRLDRVVAEVGGWSPDPEPVDPCPDPRWISSAELVRRVRPFIVYN